MIDSRIEAGKIEEEIRTSCGAGKKRKWSKIYDLKYVFEEQSRQFKGAPSGQVWGNLSGKKARIVV